MTTLITGSTGFLGSAVLRQLLKEGQKVRALIRQNSDQRNLDGLDVEIVIGDLTDRDSLLRALKDCDSLFHVAADYRLWVPNPSEIYHHNVDGTRNLMTAAAQCGTQRIVYTSSVATLGINKDETPADETTPVSLNDMIGHYKRSKFLAEREVDALIKNENLPVIIVNPSTPVGPRDIKPTPTGRMILDAVNGKIPVYVNTGLNIVHVDDVAQGHLLAFDKGKIGERYILGGEDMSLHKILLEISKVTGNAPPLFQIPHNFVLPIAYILECLARLRHAKEPLVTVDGVRLAKKKMYFSTAKAKRELGYKPRPANEALKDAVAWFLERD